VRAWFCGEIGAAQAVIGAGILAASWPAGTGQQSAENAGDACASNRVLALRGAWSRAHLGAEEICRQLSFR